MITMTQSPPDAAVELSLLRLLLDDPRVDPDNLDWSLVLPAAERQGLLLRLGAWFERRHEFAPAPVGDAIGRARDRLGCVVGLIARIEARCLEREIDHVFLKIAQQFPDVGRDIDVLVSAEARDVDAALLGRESGIAEPLTFRRRISGTSTLKIPSCDITLVVRHGRVGRLGEHELYARQLLRRQRRVCIGTASWTAPPAEDALLLMVLDRLYGRPAIPLRDVHWTISTVRAGLLDWDYLIGAARSTGLIAGLSCFLAYSEQIHRQLFAHPLLPGQVRSRLGAGDWGQVAFDAGSFRFPAARITGRLYFDEFCADVATGNWEAATRLVFLPLVAAAAGYRRLAHPMVGGL
jgi:hypothetical protein